MQRYKPEQIITLLRQIKGAVASGKTTPLPEAAASGIRLVFPKSAPHPAIGVRS